MLEADEIDISTVQCYRFSLGGDKQIVAFSISLLHPDQEPFEQAYGSGEALNVVFPTIDRLTARSVFLPTILNSEMADSPSYILSPTFPHAPPGPDVCTNHICATLIHISKTHVYPRFPSSAICMYANDSYLRIASCHMGPVVVVVVVVYQSSQVGFFCGQLKLSRNSRELAIVPYADVS